MKRITYSIACLTTITMLLSACSDSSDSVDIRGGYSNGDQNLPKSFSVSLESVDVRRASDGQAVNVDTSAVTTADLTYQ